MDFFKDRIFAITPRGEVIDLPAGATPVDFAYHIHSEVGGGCIGAKVNGRIVPLDRKLQSGDMIEIMVQKNKKPSEDWLKFVKTSAARDRIRAALRQKKMIADPKRLMKTQFRMVFEDRIGIMKDITTILARAKINIISIQAGNPEGSRFHIDRIECAISDKKKIEKIVLKLKQLKEVKEVGYRII